MDDAPQAPPAPQLYTFHSRFRTVYNYVSADGDLHCLSLPPVGAGPGITTLHTLPEPPPNQLLVLESGQLAGPQDLAFVASRAFDPRLAGDLRATPHPPWIPILEQIARQLTALMPAPTCAPLPGDRQSAPTPLLRAAQAQIDAGIDSVRHSRYAMAAQQLRGVGPGLTPAGDDVLCGLLWAFSVGDRQWQHARDALYGHAPGKNPISNHFLKSAYQGLFFEHIKAFAEAVLIRIQQSGAGAATIQQADSRLQAAFGRVLQHGETSGTDTVCGLLHGWLHMAASGRAIHSWRTNHSSAP